MKKNYKNLNTEENRRFWAAVEAAAKEVETWPNWKKGISVPEHEPEASYSYDVLKESKTETSDSYDFNVPWTTTGVKWSRNFISREEIIWKPNKPFKAALKVVRLFQQSTSSHLAEMVDQSTGQKFLMRSEDFLEAIQNTAPIFGVFVGNWRFRKTSSKCYGLQFLGKE